MRLPLIGGSYSTRSTIASAQRCVNYYPELNPKDALVPVTHYQRPGLLPRITGLAGGLRGLYRPSNSGLGNTIQGFAVAGSSLYIVNDNWTTKLLGDITPGRTNPVSMIDNGTTMMLVDGSDSGWQVDLGSGAFSQIVDPTGSFQGADRVDTIDTFLLWNMSETINFGSTLSGSLTFDPLYFAGKSGYPDLLQTLIVNRHEILLLGSLKSEIWYDAGNAQFPFAELPFAYIEHGVLAKYSVASADTAVYWLGQDLQGSAMVFRQRGYNTQSIGNPALLFAFRQMLKAGATLSDAIGYTYQQDNHVFYMLHFPSGDQTWVWDESIGDPMEGWHQRAWTDDNGTLHRDRANCHAFINGVNLVGDWENGTIYSLDLDTYFDTVAGNPCPLTCIRTLPHIGQGRDASGQAVTNDGKRMQFHRILLDLETGGAPAGALDGLPPAVSIRWSTTRGKSWSSAIMQSAGQPGEFLAQPQVRNAGIARDMVFEISHSIPGPAAFQGAWLDVEVLQT